MSDITQYVGYGFDRQGQKIICLILHDTAGGDAWTGAQWLAYWKSQAMVDNPTSAHVTILRDGTALFCVPDTLASAGAGYGVVLGYNQWNPNAKPEPRPEPNLNRACINIEIVAPKDGPVAYPAAQLAAAERICRQYLATYPGIAIYSHNEVDRQAVAQGYDPARAHHDPRDLDMDAWRAKMAGRVGSTPDPDAIRNAAWGMMKIPYNPDAALVKFARAHGLGVPMTKEFLITIANDAGGYTAQGFAGGIAWCRTGDWGNIQVLAW